MASDIKLVNVVAFDSGGNAVVQVLKKWKVDFNARRATIEIKTDGYAKTYDLRTQVVAAGIGESSKTVSIGKTLGRVALTGLLHGRHAAGADLRWGGLDRDRSQEVFLMLDDTTTVTMEMDSDEFESLTKVLPDAAKEDDAQARVGRLMDKVKAMVADGERVLTELSDKQTRLLAEDAALAGEVDAGQSFDERHAARERRGQLARQLSELAIEQRAVTYDFAVIRASKALRAQADSKTSVPATAPVAQIKQPKVFASPAPNLPVQTTAKKKTSFMGGVTKLVVWLMGACAGFMVTVFLGLLFGGGSMWMTLIVTAPVGGWLALKMLAALMRR